LSDNKTAFDAERYSRNLPVLSLDSGLVFDRMTQWGGRAATHTLEPRAYYVRIPFRDQSRLPNFSSAVSDFNFAQLFTENQFVGGDRVNDADQLTLAATSRYTDDASGEELLRWGLGQRFYFRSPRVSLAGEAPELRQTDLLATAAGQPLRHVFLDATAQVNTNTRGLEKLLVGVRYNPAPDRILNAAYRYTRNDIVGDGLKLVDLQALWPLNWVAGQQRLYGIGRYNYSIRDRKMVEGLAGIEYNAGCWKVRALAHRFTTAKDQQTTNFFIQLELVGLSRIGINPLETLRQNIAGYRRFESQSRYGEGLDTAPISPRQESCK
jgi:LPS-assembly protein